MVQVTVLLRVRPLASVTVTTKLEPPAAEGVPVTAPDEESVSPVGRLPLPSAQVSGGLPPVPLSWSEYATARVPSASAVVAMPGRSYVPRVNALVSLRPFPSVAVTVKLAGTGLEVAGEPVRWPSMPSEMPAGNPEEAIQ